MKRTDDQRRLQAILDICQKNYGWDRTEVCRRLSANISIFSDHLHKRRTTTKRLYYAVYGLVAEHEIKLKKEAKST